MSPEFSPDGLARIQIPDGSYICYLPIKAGQAKAFLAEMREKTKGKQWTPVLVASRADLEQLAKEIDSSKVVQDVLLSSKNFDTANWLMQREMHGCLSFMKDNAAAPPLEPRDYLELLGYSSSQNYRKSLVKDLPIRAVATMGGSSTDSSTGITTFSSEEILGPELSDKDKLHFGDLELQLAQEQRDKEILVCFVPVANSWEIPAYFRSNSLGFFILTEVQIALLRKWNEKYGAEMAAVSPISIELQLPKAPPSKDIPELSKELVLACPRHPSITQSNWPIYKSFLKGSTVWTLSW